MKIEIRFINEDYLFDIKKAAMNTIGKRNFNIEESFMTPEVFKKYLISEHSPIRAAIMEITFIEISYPASVHFARHIHSVPFVKSSRPDRTGKERDLKNPVDHMALFNLQALIDMMRKRLCVGKVEKETYEWALGLKLLLMKSDDVYLKIIGEILVPNCIYRCGCPEFKSCNFYKKLNILHYSVITSISARYDLYNQGVLNNE